MITSLITRNETEADREWTSYAVKNRHDIQIYLYIELKK